MTLRHLVLILFGLAMPAPALFAQAPDCADPPCTEGPVETVAVLEGGFRAAAGVSATEIDLLAALEQQRWREFRFLAETPARVFATLQAGPAVRPETWPEGVDLPGEPPALALLSSLDGNDFAGFDNGAVLPQGATLSIIVRQQTAEAADGATTFFPADWTLTVAARRIGDSAPDAPDSGAPLTRLPGAVLPDFDPLTDEAMIEVLDCAAGDCPDGDAQAPVGDTPPPAASPVGDDVASALQAELARVGCYDAAIDGLWGPASRRAMEAFNAAAGSDVDAASPSAQALVAVARATGPVCGAD